MRVWLFKSFVTDCNDILAKQIEAWAKERKVEVEFDWATFGDREQKFVAAIEAGNPPDVAEMNYQGPMRYRPALRDVTKLAKDIAGARGGLLPYADRVVQFNGQYFAVARLRPSAGRPASSARTSLDAKGLKMPKVYDPDVDRRGQEVPGPAKDLWGFGQTLNRSDDGNGFMQNILWNYGGSAWDKDGKPALATTFLKQNIAALQFAVDTIQKHKIQPPGVMGWTDVHNNEAYMAGKLVSTNNGASLYYAMVQEASAGREDAGPPHPGRSGRARSSRRRLQLGHLQGQQARRAVRGHDPLGRGREALRGVHEGVHRPGRTGLQVARRAIPTGRPIPTSRACGRTSCAACGRAIPGRSRRRPSRCRRSTSSATWPGAW